MLERSLKLLTPREMPPGWPFLKEPDGTLGLEPTRTRGSFTVRDYEAP